MNAEMVLQELEALGKERTKKCICQMALMSRCSVWQQVR